LLWSAVELKDIKPKNERAIRPASWRGVLAVALVVSGLSVGGFLAGRVLLDVLLGSTIPLLPVLVLSATLPVGVVLGGQLRTAWRH
jgi:hypothetical protein